ncbi:MAG: hypothetical protein WC421_06720 [Elusimicrobiales bacterium]
MGTDNQYLYSVTTDFFIFLLHNAYQEAFKCSYIKAGYLNALLADLDYTETGKFISIRYTGAAKDCRYPALRKGNVVPLTKDFLALAENPGKGGFSAYELQLRDRKGLEAFLARYLQAYEAGQCHCREINYFPYQTGMDVIESLFGPSYIRFGATFYVTAKLEHADFEQHRPAILAREDPFHLLQEFRERLRLGELLLSLAGKSYISIQDADYDEDKPGLLNILVRFERSPQEIKDIEGYWLAYGGLRVNEADGVAFYKNNRYPFASNRTLEFKLLCHLIKNHGKKLSITKTYDSLSGGEETFGTAKETIQCKKSRMKDYVKNLRHNLGIAADKTPSVDIMLTGENVLLIATPPVRA